jgi:hypothetical protein
MRVFAAAGLLAALVLSLGGLGLSGCGSGGAPQPGASPVHGVQAQSQDQQIRSAIQAHLTQVNNLNLQSFSTNVTNVQVQGDHAQAQVDFHVKGGPGVMQFAYQLERRDGNWAVTQSNPVGAHSDTAPAR